MYVISKFNDKGGGTGPAMRHDSMSTLLNSLYLLVQYKVYDGIMSHLELLDCQT